MKKLLENIKKGFKKLVTITAVATVVTTVASASTFNAQPRMIDTFAVASVKTVTTTPIVFAEGTKAEPVAQLVVAREAQLVEATTNTAEVKTVVLDNADGTKTVVKSATKMVLKETVETVAITKNIVRTVKSGDTLFGIGMENNMLWTTVQKANSDITNANLIKIGQKVTIPNRFHTVLVVVKTAKLVKETTNATVEIPAVKVVPTVANDLTATPVNGSVVKNHNVPVLTDTMAVIGVNAENDAVETVEKSVVTPVVSKVVVKATEGSVSSASKLLEDLD